MGGEDNDTKTSKTSDQLVKSERCESLFDAAVSKLLQDFTSAELFPQSSTSSLKEVTCQEGNCDSMISSLKHLHLRRPVLAKQRRQRMNNRKKLTPNKLNLAVAAGNYQKPIVWPSRLNSHFREKQGNPYALHPSRLCWCANDSLSGGSMFKSTVGDTKRAIKLCSCQERSRIEASLSRHARKPFSKVSEQILSFKSLHSQDDSSGIKSITSCALSKDANDSALYSSSKGLSSDHSAPVKFTRTTTNGESLVTHGAAFADYRHLGSFDSSDHEEMLVKFFHQFPVTAAKHSTQFSCDNQHSVHKQSESGGASPSSLDTLAPLRSALCSAMKPSFHSCSDICSLSCSCSQEVKMEDTNVNELASYFEDFLHIPRKMSTMAEMMYT